MPPGSVDGGRSGCTSRIQRRRSPLLIVPQRAISASVRRQPTHNPFASIRHTPMHGVTGVVSSPPGDSIGMRKA